MTDMVFGAAPARPGEPIIPHWWRTIDRWSLAAIIALFLCGMLLGLAASPPLAVKNGLDPFHYVTRQAAFGVVALLAMIVVSMMAPQTLRRLAVVAFLGSVMAVALLPVLGTDFGKGAVRWYSLGFVSVQPSEFLKPTFAIFAAWLMAASYDVNGPPGRTLSFAAAVILTAMLALQPDFGQAGLIIATWGLMYFAAGAPVVLLGGVGGGVLAAGWFAYHNSEHVARRIDGFLASEVDPRTQIGYATNAIQEGGFLGVGVGNGQVKWILPDAHTDFIIAVAAEEYGLILCVVIMGLFMTIVVRSLLRLVRERDPFIRLAGTGLAVLLGMQSMINMGVAVRLLPAKGMTLPLISYGGSSLIAAGLGLGVLLAMTRKRPQHDLDDILGARWMAPLLVIAAGGTGGHMFPAQALAEEMLARGWRVKLATDARGARYAGGFPAAVTRQITAAATFGQGGLLARATAPLAIAWGTAASLIALRRDPPAVVAGFGGYPALPAMAAATLLGVPRVIHEQNGVLGKVNRRFAPRVEAVACGVWPTALPEGARAVHVGNPVREAVRARAGASYPAPVAGPIELLVIGGSQGAGLFARVIPQAIALLPEALRARLKLSQQVRPEDMARAQDAYAALGAAAELRGFFDDVPERLARAALVISRAGAGSIADITAIGRPAILIPYPHATDDHQAANAAGLVSAGGAFMIREEALTPEGLAGHIAAILSDPEGAEAMAWASHAQGRPDAAVELADLVERLAAGRARIAAREKERQA